MMNINNKYLNFDININILDKLGINLHPNIIVYNKFFCKEYYSNPSDIKPFIKDHIESWINKKYNLINIIDADINYYIEHINILIKYKFNDVITEINIDHLISMCDYMKIKAVDENELSNNSKQNYIYWKNQYYFMIYENILCNNYKPVGITDKVNLIKLIDNLWKNIKFDNLIKFIKTLNKISYKGQDVSKYFEMIINKFDNSENILKLLEYINKNFIDDDDINNLNNEFISDITNYENTNEISKYNFRFIVEHLKSNGYLLFEEHNKQLKNKYKKVQSFETIKKDKELVNYFIYLISLKDSNSVNRKVNEILIKMRNYLCDLLDNNKNQIGYQKITVNQDSEKYKNVDLTSYDRTNAIFNIFKYSNAKVNPVSNFNLNSDIEPYFDIYSSYYNSRYPDRQLEYDPFQSTIVIKVSFLEKKYLIHMALIQYIILDLLFKIEEGINIIIISKLSKIPIQHLQETINSLLQIKLIKRTNSKSIEDLKFFINYNFSHENNKISISSLILKEKEETDIKKEYLHDRNTIVLSNLYDYMKKTKTFTKTILETDLQYKIPFKITNEQIEMCIKTLLDKEHIVSIQMTNPYNSEGCPDIIYKYIE